MGVPVVDNTPNNKYTRLYLREALDQTGAFGTLFSGPGVLPTGGHYGHPGMTRVQIPENATPGQMLSLPVPAGWNKAGEMITFLVPLNIKPGDFCFVPLPRDVENDEQLAEKRSPEVIAAAQSTRLQMLQIRDAKSCPAPSPQITDDEKGRELEDPVHPLAVAHAHTTCASSQNSEMEVCAVCQVEVAASERVLACKQCDNGFHVRCLNSWLLRADSCPCCRATIAAC